jgi:hypothetical protein
MKRAAAEPSRTKPLAPSFVAEMMSNDDAATIVQAREAQPARH